MMIDHLLNPKRFLKIENHLYAQIGLNSFSFQEEYINIRTTENRNYNSDQLKALPDVAETNVHHHEWRIRKNSTNKLLNYLNQRKDITSILEIGCGNGWLSNRIAANTDYTVVGLDVNLVELKQGAKAFEGCQRLYFVFGNIMDDIFVKNSFDIVVLAAAIQYFNILPDLFTHIFPLLKEGGEIHILDSPIYRAEELASARRRSAKYFASLGHADMQRHYFHHSIDALKEFNPAIMYNPRNVKNRILRKWIVTDLSPFPWIRIKVNRNQTLIKAEKNYLSK